jgi:general secretion pathway protein A
MYKQFFGLSENPFNVNPDPRYLYLTARTRAALDELAYGIKARQGLMLLTGEVGTGKTTLLNRLLDWLHQQKAPTAFIFNPHLETGHLFDLILAEFEVPPDRRFPDNALMRLNHWLIERYRAGDNPVLIVDEAQGLSRYLLEEIRMLLNLETPHEKLLQIVLSGQPEIEERLKRNDLRQLKQRITLRCRTGMLTLEETHEYIQARLHVAGANGTPIFSSPAMDAVHFYSRGIPRITNLLCEHALINAYVDRVQPVPAQIIEEIAREFQLDELNSFDPSVDADGATGVAGIRPQRALKPMFAPALMEAEPLSRQISDVAANCVSVSNDVTGSLLTQPRELGTQVLDCDAALPPAEIIIAVPMPSAVDRSEHECVDARETADSIASSPGAVIELCSEFAKEDISISIALPVDGVVERVKVDLPPGSGQSRVGPPTQKAAHWPTVVNDAKQSTPANSGPIGFQRLGLSIADSMMSWKRHFLSASGAPLWKQRITTSFLGLKRSISSVGALCRGLPAQRIKERQPIAATARLPRITSVFYEWLREPLDPTQLWRVPYSWLCRPRRKLSQTSK